MVKRNTTRGMSPSAWKGHGESRVHFNTHVFSFKLGLQLRKKNEQVAQTVSGEALDGNSKCLIPPWRMYSQPLPKAGARNFGGKRHVLGAGQWHFKAHFPREHATPLRHKYTHPWEALLKSRHIAYRMASYRATTLRLLLTVSLCDTNNTHTCCVGCILPSNYIKKRGSQTSPGRSRKNQ